MWCLSWYSSCQAILWKMLKGAGGGAWWGAGWGSDLQQSRCWRSTLVRLKSSLFWHSTLTYLTFPLQINYWIYLMGDICFKVQYLLQRWHPGTVTGLARRNLAITEPFAKSLCTFETHYTTFFNLSISSAWFTWDKVLCAIKCWISLITTAWGSIKYTFMEQSFMNVWYACTS